MERVREDLVYLLVTAVPLPGLTWPVGHEVGGPPVLHPLRESQQDPYIVVCDIRAVGGAEWWTHISGPNTLRKNGQLVAKRMSKERPKKKNCSTGKARRH